MGVTEGGRRAGGRRERVRGRAECGRGRGCEPTRSKLDGEWSGRMREKGRAGQEKEGPLALTSQRVADGPGEPHAAYAELPSPEQHEGQCTEPSGNCCDPRVVKYMLRRVRSAEWADA